MSDLAAVPSPAAPSPTTTNATTSSVSPGTETKTNTANAQLGPSSGATDTTKPNSKLADASADAKKPGETPAQAEARRKYKLKVDGAEQELELNDSEISVRLQKAIAAEKRMAQAAEIQKSFRQFSEMFPTDPSGAAKLIAPDLNLEEYYEKKLIEKFQAEERQKQDPAAYEREQLKKQLEEYRTKEQKAKEAADAKAQAEHDAKVGKEMEKEFMDALEESGLPKDRRYLRMLAEVADVNLEHGIELTPKQMAAEVNSQLREQHQHVVRGMKGESLIKHLGADVVKEVLKYSVDQHRAKQSVVTAPTAKGEETPAQRDARKLKSGSELRNFFRGLRDGKD